MIAGQKAGADVPENWGLACIERMVAAVGDGLAGEGPPVQPGLEAAQELCSPVVAVADAQAVTRRIGQREAVPGAQVVAGKARVGPLVVGHVERHPQLGADL